MDLNTEELKQKIIELKSRLSVTVVAHFYQRDEVFEMGDITGDLNHRRGRILGMDSEDGLQVITAEVPQAEMFQYASQLRSMTGGRGSFDMEFSRMDVVPSNIAQKIIAEAAKHKQEEEE